MRQHTGPYIGNIYHVHINVSTCTQKAYVLCVYYICGNTYKTPCIDTPCPYINVWTCPQKEQNVWICNIHITPI